MIAGILTHEKHRFHYGIGVFRILAADSAGS